MDDPWTDWIAHDGAGRPAGFDGPIPLVVEVEVHDRRRKPRTYEDEELAGNIMPACWDWSQFRKPHPECSCGVHTIPRILRYKLRKSPEIEKLRESIETLPVVKTLELEEV